MARTLSIQVLVGLLSIRDPSPDKTSSYPFRIVVGAGHDGQSRQEEESTNMAELSSSFAWLDYSEAERRRMNEVIGLFRDQGILDELGVGSVRDAFADLLYPGTSTIQTRARYFLFVPWIYLGIERERIPSVQAAERARADQIRLIYALERGSEYGGVIGIDAREHLQRLPSSIYWNGLALFRIRRFPGGIEQYHRSLDAHYVRLKEAPRIEEGERSDLGLRANWDPAIPSPERKWLKASDFALTYEEANYLTDRIVSEAPDSLLAHLLQRATDVGEINAPWTDPDLSTLPTQVQNQLLHARNFSQLMLGAVTLYNAMLAEAAGREDLLHAHLEALSDWSGEIASNRQHLARWNRREFWSVVRHVNPRISFITEAFIETWIGLALDASDSLFENDAARRLIVERERRRKRGLARLSNPKALEIWSGTSSVTPLLYRWPNARQIISDILDGLRRSSGVEQLAITDA